ncbi:hypothetical protein OH76DRAFT_1490609 [Lentinus brumalis]|uniref:Uncharacterized protein n=1 Tax=Lentinus brumalis TaxID=2498619 RepID=A0A371CIF3_9APHY|nr:hypothetical protein OH76DRAFT_1490609 [Polyporus brumalis]
MMPFEPHISGKVMDIYYSQHCQLLRRRGYYAETEKLEIATILTPNPLHPPVPIIDI